ncbi:hypothetical protein GGX14DRAFT_641610 [Mycena pura]|uniref:Cytochrome c oxidase assembly protein COX19 n=1 Tax=Mycena pura TaxID=153505 RepID=A0AAD6YQ03_9AGAR|nr:hypothetical protein GGX14DRAFT_641610 [Mycena pura]
MSFGRPPSINVGFKPLPPDRGAFPLDHDGECKEQMKLYMTCLRSNSGTSTPCRPMSQNYLDCRMNKGLMERDEWKNLGFETNETKDPEQAPSTQSESNSARE